MRTVIKVIYLLMLLMFITLAGMFVFIIIAPANYTITIVLATMFVSFLYGLVYMFKKL